mgnify:CR=1 FL=1
MDNKLLKMITTIMFAISGFYKLYDPSIGMRKLSGCNPSLFKNQTFLYLIVLLAGIWELLACLGIYFGSKNQQLYGIYSLILFTILATLLCHFPPVKHVYYPFISNVTTIGGLLCLAKLINNH